MCIIRNVKFNLVCKKLWYCIGSIYACDYIIVMTYIYDEYTVDSRVILWVHCGYVLVLHLLLFLLSIRHHQEAIDIPRLGYQWLFEFKSHSILLGFHQFSFVYVHISCIDLFSLVLVHQFGVMILLVRPMELIRCFSTLTLLF